MTDLSLSLIIATWYQPTWASSAASWQHPALIIPRRGILDAYQLGYESCQSDILFYAHDDLLCLDSNWLPRVLAEFSNPQVALVGFAGAPGYGHPLMYTKPYHHSSLGRVGFASNLLNAEQHGARFTGSRSVAVLDGMALIVRRAFLSQINGWEWRRGTPCDYFMYAEALAFMALRHGYKIRQVGVAVDHLGGRSTGLNPDLHPQFEAEHEWLFEEFRDIMPVMVEE